MDEAEKKFLHDLSGSLAVIKGFLKFLEQSSLNDTQREYHGAALRSADKIERAIGEARANEIILAEYTNIISNE